MTKQIKPNDQVIFNGKAYTIESVHPEGVVLSATGALAGYSRVDRLVEIEAVKLSENQELANQYGVNAQTIQFEWVWFIENEGYLDDGYECHTFGHWLEKRLGRKSHNAEPFQKGDLGYGLS